MPILDWHHHSVLSLGLYQGISALFVLTPTELINYISPPLGNLSGANLTGSGSLGTEVF